MNESFIHHIVRVALILGIIIGIAGFSALLYVSDFWSGGAAQTATADVASTPVDTGPAPTPETADFAQRSATWVFGKPENVPAAAAHIAQPISETPILPAAPPQDNGK